MKLNKKYLKRKTYIATDIVSLPVLRQNFEKPPVPPSPGMLSLLMTGTAPTYADPYDSLYEPDVETAAPQPLTQNELDAKMSLSQRNSEFLISFLKRRKLTANNVNATSYRKRQSEFQQFYSVDLSNTLTYCNDIKSVVNMIGMEYVATDWRLFIDGSVSSLKAVLLDVTNKKPAIPIAMGVNIKESYHTLKDIMEKIKYEEHKWKICSDLKVVNILQGIIEKGGYPKYFCYLCNWDSRSKINQYTCKDWEKRNSENVKELKLLNDPIIKNIHNILLPPLHIKLGIVKKFVQAAVENDNNVFCKLKTIFPNLSDSKIKAGVLNGPDIRKLMKDESFASTLTSNYRKAWAALKDVIIGVLGKNREPPKKVHELVKKMLDCFEKISVSMTLKLHFLHFHLDEFLKQLPSESDEQGEWFHQTTMPMEKRFKGKKLDALIAEVCWWSQKIYLYEKEHCDDTEKDPHGTEEDDSFTYILASSDDEEELRSKKQRVSCPGPSTSHATF